MRRRRDGARVLSLDAVTQRHHSLEVVAYCSTTDAVMSSVRATVGLRRERDRWRRAWIVT
jgi:hypothetical protein